MIVHDFRYQSSCNLHHVASFSLNDKWVYTLMLNYTMLIILSTKLFLYDFVHSFVGFNDELYEQSRLDMCTTIYIIVLVQDRHDDLYPRADRRGV